MFSQEAALRRKNRPLVFLILSLIILGVILNVTRVFPTINFDINTDEISRIEIFSHGQTAVISQEDDIIQITENINSLTLEPNSDTGIGFIYRLTFYGDDNSILGQMDITSSTSLKGYSVIDGRIDFNILKEVFEKAKAW